MKYLQKSEIKMTENTAQENRILLVEDEETLAVGLEYNLSAEGYQVVWAADGKQALECFKSQTFDLIILDIMLPYYNGFEVAQFIRTNSPQIPILILTARTGIVDRLRGLELGADDYLTKPFHLPELLLRVKGMLRRKAWYKELKDYTQIYRFGTNEINFSNLTAQSGKQQIKLTPHEGMVLKYLIEHKGEIVSRKELLEKVWQISSTIETRTIDNFIVRLRKYFEPDHRNPIFFKSIRSVGYMFTEEVSD